MNNNKQTKSLRQHHTGLREMEWISELGNRGGIPTNVGVFDTSGCFPKRELPKTIRFVGWKYSYGPATESPPVTESLGTLLAQFSMVS